MSVKKKKGGKKAYSFKNILGATALAPALCLLVVTGPAGQTDLLELPAEWHSGWTKVVC